MSSSRPFRFAVQATTAKSGREWRDLARRVEDLGYDTLFLADHYLGKGPATRESRQWPQHLAPIAAMATAAAVTERMRVGCRVFCIDYHVPAALAKEAATLDLLSDGRLEFGIGAGWSEVEYRAMGIAFERPGARIAKLQEVINLVRAHWSGEELDLSGDHVNVRGYTGLPRPVQQPHPPIMIGGAGKRVLSLAGREADIVSLSTLPWVPRTDDGLTMADEAARRVGYARAAAGERFAEIDVESSPYFVAVTDDVTAELAKVAAAVGGDPLVLAEHPNVLVGTQAAVIERLHSWRDVIGINYVTVQQANLEGFAPVVAALAGR